MKIGCCRISIDEFVFTLVIPLFHADVILKCLCQTTNIFNLHGMSKDPDIFYLQFQFYKLSSFVICEFKFDSINLIRGLVIFFLVVLNRKLLKMLWRLSACQWRRCDGYNRCDTLNLFLINFVSKFLARSSFQILLKSDGFKPFWISIPYKIKLKQHL